MNILFIEDDRDLKVSAVAQLELKGHKVYPAYDLAASRKILSDSDIKIDLIISDHRLPDGLGIQFAIEMREQFPACKCVIVSGCFTDQDIELLEEQKIPYYRKPLLYARLIDDIRRPPAYVPPTRMEWRNWGTPKQPPASAPAHVPATSEPEVVMGPTGAARKQKRKKLLGIWPLM